MSMFFILSIRLKDIGGIVIPISFVDAQRLSMERRQKEFDAIVALIDSLIKDYCESYMLDGNSKIHVDITSKQRKNMNLMPYLESIYKGWHISFAEHPMGDTLVFAQSHMS